MSDEENNQSGVSFSMSINLVDDQGKLRKFSDIEKDLIEAAINLCGGSKRKAAQQLGVGRNTIYRKLKGYNP